MPRTNPPPTQQSTRETIKRVFLRLYKKKPLSRIFVSDLVQACSISRGTFYFYFNNIEDLYHECEQDLIDKMEDGLDKVILCTVGGSRADMTKYIQTYAKHLSRYPKYLEEYHCLLEGSERASFRQCWVDSVRRHFEQTLPFSRTVSPSEREHLLFYYSGGTVSMLSNWVLNDCKAPAEELAAISAQTLFQGTFLTDPPDRV